MEKNDQFIPVNIDQKLEDIGLMVRELRKANCKNYVEFAEEHKINKVTLLRIENGENFKMSSLLQVLNALEITIEELFK
jgi:transcriptional regulator with XRE-family HTH domain